MEELKGKLAVAEQQLAEQQRRDAEARAEISMLVNSLSMQKQSHQQVCVCSAACSSHTAAPCWSSSVSS